jgi:tellurite resistance protein
MTDHHTALIYTMVLVSAADSRMTDAELRTIGEIVRYLPVFADYDAKRLPADAQGCAKILEDENGLEQAFGMITKALPKKLYETAYALACDVAAAERKISQETLRLLEMIRYELAIDPLAAAAIERGARARHMTV